MKKNIKINDSNIQKYLFIGSLIVCLILGVSLTYNFDFSKNYNLLFESDSNRVINDITNYSFNHYRTSVHPLFVIITEPVYFLVKAIFINKMLSLVVISSLVTTFTVLFIYKILSLYGKDKLLKIVICLSYLFSFSNYIFTAGIEAYNIAALFLVLLWYYALKKYHEKNYTSAKYFILILLGVTAFGITITNYMIFLIIVFFLLIFKKLKFKNAFLVVLASLLIAVGLSYTQSLLWHNTRFISSSIYNGEKEYSNYKITPKKILNVIKNDYYYAIIGNDIHVESNDQKSYHGDNYVITFNYDNNLLLLAIVSGFYILLIIVVIRNYPKHLFANLCLTSAILFNTILHTIYGNKLPFLYSMHFLYLFYLIFGINLMHEKNKTLVKIAKYYLIILLIFQLIFNNLNFIKIVDIAKSILQCNYYVANFNVLPTILFIMSVLLIILFIIHIIYQSYKRFRLAKNSDNKIKYGILIAVLIMTIQCICIGLEANEANKKFIFTKTNGNSKDIHINTDKYLEKDTTTFKKHFKNEFKAYHEYEREYTKLLKTYNPQKITFLNKDNYYFFGLANRRKLLFHNDMLIDITTNETLYSWNVFNCLIIPNEYTVIIETIKKDYIKIYEDNNGVHYNINGKETIIEGTETKINIYNFENQKWANTKKVLYSEILFNIKDSAIYPNILVYDSPWYRDAALGSMVLKLTNNTDLISNWVNSISEVYDKQNHGALEPDNLGELLYLISTQTNHNSSLINKIETEAKRLAENNKDGYYLNGDTDFSAKPLYQNLWYQCGANALNREFNFDITNLDDGYGVLTWWMNNQVASNKRINSDSNYPYLSIASYHKLGKGHFPMNANMYPLSWEIGASEADYQNMQVLDGYYVSSKLSPLHTWAAAELFLLLSDENQSLNLCNN